MIAMFTKQMTAARVRTPNTTIPQPLLAVRWRIQLERLSARHSRRRSPIALPQRPMPPPPCPQRLPRLQPGRGPSEPFRLPASTSPAKRTASDSKAVATLPATSAALATRSRTVTFPAPSPTTPHARDPSSSAARSRTVTSPATSAPGLDQRQLVQDWRLRQPGGSIAQVLNSLASNAQYAPLNDARGERASGNRSRSASPPAAREQAQAIACPGSPDANLARLHQPHAVKACINSSSNGAAASRPAHRRGVRSRRAQTRLLNRETNLPRVYGRRRCARTIAAPWSCKC